MHASPPPRHRRPRRPLGWLWGGVALVGALTLTATLIRLQETACAADTTRHGDAIYYTVNRREGSCSYGPLSADGRYASLSSADYSNAAACGVFLDVTGPRGTVRVQAVDRCLACDPGELDLSHGAFVRIADPAQGRAAIRYRVVRDPRPVRPLTFRVKRGSSDNWFGLLATGHGNPLRRVEVRSPGHGWRALWHGPDNYWTTSGAGPGPFAVRVTDVFGNSAVTRAIKVEPGSILRTHTRLYASGPHPMSAAESQVGQPLPRGHSGAERGGSAMSPRQGTCR